MDILRKIDEGEEETLTDLNSSDCTGWSYGSFHTYIPEIGPREIRP